MPFYQTEMIRSFMNGCFNPKRAIALLCTLLLGYPVAGLAEEMAEITLAEALQRALLANEQIALQEYEVSIAGREVSRAWTIISPRLEASGRYERPEEELRRDGQVIVPEDSWRATITARQPLFDGRVLPARRLGLALEQAEMNLLAFTIQNALFQTTRLYFATLNAAKQVEVAKQTVKLAEEEVTRARARFEAGEARRTELLRAEVDESQAFRRLVEARNELHLAQVELSRDIDWPTSEPFTLVPPEPLPSLPEKTMEELLLEATEQRRDLAAIRYQRTAREEQRDVIRRDVWPTLNLEFNHRFVDPESFSSRNNSWDVAAVARIDLWDGGTRRINRLQQSERVEQANWQIIELENTIHVEVQRAWLDLQTLRENLATLRKEVTLAEENYRTLSEQARVGLATSLDVSTALNALAVVRTQLARQEYDVEVAKHRVALVTGVFANEFIDMEDRQPREAKGVMVDG